MGCDGVPASGGRSRLRAGLPRAVVNAEDGYSGYSGFTIFPAVDFIVLITPAIT